MVQLILTAHLITFWPAARSGWGVSEWASSDIYYVDNAWLDLTIFWTLNTLAHNSTDLATALVADKMVQSTWLSRSILYCHEIYRMYRIHLSIATNWFWHVQYKWSVRSASKLGKKGREQIMVLVIKKLIQRQEQFSWLWLSYFFMIELYYVPAHIVRKYSYSKIF